MSALTRLRVVAMLLGASLIIGEAYRSWGAGRTPTAWLDDMLMGTLIYVEGKLKTRKWTDKDGVEKYTTEIHCHEMKLLSSRQDGDGESEGRRREQPAQQQRPQPARSSAPIDDEDIPFANPYRGSFLYVI